MGAVKFRYASTCISASNRKLHLSDSYSIQFKGDGNQGITAFIQFLRLFKPHLFEHPDAIILISVQNLVLEESGIRWTGILLLADAAQSYCCGMKSARARVRIDN